MSAIRNAARLAGSPRVLRRGTLRVAEPDVLDEYMSDLLSLGVRRPPRFSWSGSHTYFSIPRRDESRLDLQYCYRMAPDH